MGAGLLTQRLARLAAAFCVLLGLAACATSPSARTAFEPQAIETVAAAMDDDFIPQLLPGRAATAMTADAPSDSLAVLPTVPAPLLGAPFPDAGLRPALLGGEAAREFERGGASWYGPGFQGRRTANGERYDMNAMTAAHRTLPFGTWVRVHSLVNGRDVDVRINDRGPYSGNRVIDVSRAAAEELGMLGMGFKEVVLLVPESTPEVAVSPPLPIRKPNTRRNARRKPIPKSH